MRRHLQMFVIAEVASLKFMIGLAHEKVCDATCSSHDLKEMRVNVSAVVAQPTFILHGHLVGDEAMTSDQRALHCKWK